MHAKNRVVQEWLKGLLLLLLLALANFTKSPAQTMYGVHGLIQVPDAYTTENGSADVGFGLFKDEYYKHQPGVLHDQWAVLGSFGFHSRFDIGFRLVGTPDISGNDTNYRYGYPLDRALNAKFLVLKEKKYRPQISIGGQDIVGTRIFNAAYVVVSKKWQLAKPLDVRFTAGWGLDLFKHAFNHRYSGPFGGIQLTHTWFQLSAEYINEKQVINAGIGLKYKEMVRLHLLMNNSGKEPGGMVSFRFKV